MRIKNKKTNGFSLIEVIIAMFIFVVVATAVSAIFGKIILAYKNTRTTQKNLENAQFAMNQMAKTVRTSSVISCNPNCSVNANIIRVYDYSQQKCIVYAFDGSHNLVYSYKNVLIVDKDTGCVTGDYAGFSSGNAISGTVNAGNFAVTLPVDAVQTGRVTISMKVCADSACLSPATIQTTVSLRNKEVAP